MQSRVDRTASAARGAAGTAHLRGWDRCLGARLPRPNPSPGTPLVPGTAGPNKGVANEGLSRPSPFSEYTSRSWSKETWHPKIPFTNRMGVFAALPGRGLGPSCPLPTTSSISEN